MKPIISEEDAEYLMALEHIDLKARQMADKYTKKILAQLHALHFIVVHYPKDHPTRKVAKAKLIEVLGGI
jgi:hypothetical protein|tara:strand:+ start:168 stop:377 length:210 start_codon:yes stop_codon:yes gene_type:complete